MLVAGLQFARSGRKFVCKPCFSNPIARTIGLGCSHRRFKALSRSASAPSALLPRCNDLNPERVLNRTDGCMAHTGFVLRGVRLRPRQPRTFTAAMRTTMKNLIRATLGSGLLLLAIAASASIFGAVHGLIHDPQHRPVEGAKAMLRSTTSEWLQTTSSNNAGEFDFENVPV